MARDVSCAALASWIKSIVLYIGTVRLEDDYIGGVYERATLGSMSFKQTTLYWGSTLSFELIRQE